MAMTMPGKPFNENDIQNSMGIHMMTQPHPPSLPPHPQPHIKPPLQNPQRLPALRQEGFNGGGGMGSPIMKGRVLDGQAGMLESRSLPNVGEGIFSHLSDHRGRESVDSERRRKQYARMRTMPNAPLTRSAMSVPDDEKPKFFNPDPMPYQASNFNPPLAKVRVEGTGVSLPGVSFPQLPPTSPRGPSTFSVDRSSTVIKKVPTMNRHQDMWGGPGPLDIIGKHKGFVMHAERYQLQINAEAYPRPPGWNQPPTGPVGLDMANGPSGRHTHIGMENIAGPGRRYNHTSMDHISGPSGRHTHIGMDHISGISGRNTHPGMEHISGPSGRHTHAMEALPRPLTEYSRLRPHSSNSRATFPLDYYHSNQAYYYALQQHTPLPELPSPIITKGLNSAYHSLPKSPLTPFRFGKWNDFSRNTVDGASISQRDRMALEQEYMERMKIYKRRREIIQHREPVDLLLGGEKVSYCERLDITGELNKLKQVVLPRKAKDLYVGRGFQLPDSHSLNRPKKTMAPTKKTPPYAQAFSRTTAMKDVAKPSVIWCKSDVNSDIKPQTLELDTSLPASSSLVGEAIGNKSKLKQKAPATPADAKASGEEGNWTKPEGNEKPRNSNLVGAPNFSVDRHDDGKSAVDQSLKPDQDSVPPQSFTPAKSASPNKGYVTNPLRGLINSVEESSMKRLRERFKELDADADGHVQFSSVKSELPVSLNSNHEKFIKQIYDTCCSHSQFGENEFVSIIETSQRISKLSGQPSEAYDTLQNANVEESVNQYMELFESLDRQEKGKISLEAFREILSTTKGSQVEDSEFNNIKVTITENMPELSDEIRKEDYLVLIPYLVTLESKTG